MQEVSKKQVRVDEEAREGVKKEKHGGLLTRHFWTSHRCFQTMSPARQSESNRKLPRSLRNNGYAHARTDTQQAACIFQISRTQIQKERARKRKEVGEGINRKRTRTLKNSRKGRKDNHAKPEARWAWWAFERNTCRAKQEGNCVGQLQRKWEGETSFTTQTEGQVKDKYCLFYGLKLLCIIVLQRLNNSRLQK